VTCPGHMLQVMKSHIEHAGAVLQMEPKADYVARKKKQRHERPLSPHNPANANGIPSGVAEAAAMHRGHCR
jgi:hypothetical protein